MDDADRPNNHLENNSSNYSCSQGFSQPFQATQTYEIQYTNDGSISNQFSTLSQDPVNLLAFPSPWGRLVSRKGKSYDLVLKQNLIDINKYNAHIIGRGASCDVLVNSSNKISNNHCRIYCKIDYSAQKDQIITDNDITTNSSTLDSESAIHENLLKNLMNIEVWMDDLSSNGTFINGFPMTKKGSCSLRHGDLICLINPDLDPKKPISAKLKALENTIQVTSEEILSNSFDLMIFLPNESTKKLDDRSCSRSISSRTNTRNDQTSPISEESQIISSSEATAIDHTKVIRSRTIKRLLGESRVFSDYFERGRLIGNGAAGKVFEAYSKESGQIYAVKIIHLIEFKSLSSRKEIDALSSVLKEAEMLRTLRHPNIIHLEDFFADDTYIYLVMELSKGGDLFDRLASKTIYNEDETRQVMKQVLEAIKYLHERKVAHRDLKLENILLVDEKSDVNIKLADFGLAKEVDDKGGLKSYCGTPQYFCPEVLQRKFTVAGVGRYTLQADMWSVGVVMYVLLCGKYPFNDESLMEHILSANYSLTGGVWDTVSEDAKDLIKHLIVVDPNMRLTAADSLKHKWFAVNPSSHMNGESHSSLVTRTETFDQQNTSDTSIPSPIGVSYKRKRSLKDTSSPGTENNVRFTRSMTASKTLPTSESRVSSRHLKINVRKQINYNGDSSQSIEENKKRSKPSRRKKMN